jgi:hypothetical protein
MSSIGSAFAFAFALAVGSVAPLSAAVADDLRAPDAFASAASRTEQSQALFVEAGKVLLHPRCLNCHPAGERPTQGQDMHPHQPPVFRGADGHGVPAMECTSCHQAANYAASGVPGNPQWHLAPASMAWQEKSLGQICVQIKDVSRNGGKSLAALLEHFAHDSLVGWAWSPGSARAPAPGTQAQLGALIAAWIDTGAACPTP